MPKSFVHLHLHTKYSLLDGACHIDQLCKRAVDLGMPAVAITDHGVMFGVVDFVKTCKKFNIKPIIGCEVYINATTSRHDRDPNSRYNHLVLLAETTEGYYNLAKLSSLAHAEGFYYKPRIDKELLKEYSKGLICLTACLQGEVSVLLKEQHLDEAEKVARQYGEFFGENNFFIEMQDHGIAEQKIVNEGAREISRRTGFPCVVTNDVHYLHRSHAEAHELMLAIQTGATISSDKRMRYEGDQFYFKSREEMEAIFPNDIAALDITVDIAERCKATVEFDKKHFPVFDVPGKLSNMEYLLLLGHAGLQQHYGIRDCLNPANDEERKLMERFNYEVSVVEQTNFIDYFLVVQDFIRYAKSKGIPVGPGRGSGSGSLLAYALGITNIDPIRFNLVFERFLNPERVSPPDFDIDFCQNRRGEVIEYVKQKYGGDRVAQIITLGQLGAKMVIKDLARVFEIPVARSNEMSNLIPDDPKITLEKAKEANPAFAAACVKDPDLRRIMPHAQVIEGMFRNVGVHAAGVVIGDAPLIDIVPLGRDKEGAVITQYEKGPVEDCGLLKMDFLGLKTLTVLHDSVKLIRQFHGVDLDLDAIPFDDAQTFELLNSAKTIGVFQLESAGMRKLIRDIGIHNIEDLFAVIALFRPGPMNMLPSYTERKTGSKKVEYDHPLLEPIVSSTYGIMVYQEQVQRAANVLAGYSLGQADLLRRAMGKKQPEEMAKERSRFVNGCKNLHNIPEALADKIFNRMADFAGYGFNKAHTAAYGIVSYQTAYIKAHYPVEFMCAQISSEIGNSDKLPQLVNEAIEMGIPILPPSVNHSYASFVPENGKIRYGLAGIKSVGVGAADAIVDARKAGGPFKDLIDFCQRVSSQQVNKRAIEPLIRSGAMDDLGKHRGQLLCAIDFAMARAAENAKEAASGQLSLFNMMDKDSQAEVNELPDAPDLSDSERLQAERDLLGIYLTGHPLHRFKNIIADFQTHSLSELVQLKDGQEGRFAAIIATVQRRISKQNKEPWAVLTVDNGESMIEALVFPDAFKNYEHLCQLNLPVMLCASVNLRDGKPKLTVREIYALDEAPRRFTELVTVTVPKESATKPMIDDLHKIIAKFPGNHRLLICLEHTAGDRCIIEAGYRHTVEPSAELTNALETHLGTNRVHCIARQNICLKPRQTWRNGGAYS